MSTKERRLYFTVSSALLVAPLAMGSLACGNSEPAETEERTNVGRDEYEEPVEPATNEGRIDDEAEPEVAPLDMTAPNPGPEEAAIEAESESE